MEKNVLKHKIDFVVLVTANYANPNGDPLDGNRPRTDYNGYGEISDVCVKRKIRNRMQDLGNKIFVQSDDRADDGCKSLHERADRELPKLSTKKGKDGISKEKYAETACEKWLDVRSFGQVFAFSKGKKEDEEAGGKGVSVGVRGPVSIHQGVSISKVDIHSMQITKSVNGEPDEKRSSDTMGMKHSIKFGLYKIKGSINVQLAEKTGFSEEDAETVKECLRTLFVNDSSSARPDGSMEVHKLYWWKHSNKNGQYPSAKVHRLVDVKLRDESRIPESADDYEITLGRLDGLDCEEIDGE